MRPLSRRDFLRALPAAALATGPLAFAGAPVSTRNATGGGPSADRPGDPERSPSARWAIRPFDYDGVTLSRSRWRDQFLAAREYYFGIPDDDILHGYRAAAGLPAPGRTLGGWAQRNSHTVFGQWLSGMARICRATGDDDLREKAIRLVEGYRATLDAAPDPGLRHYPYDKLVCGLVDLELYARYGQARPLLDRLTGWAADRLDRSNHVADPLDNRGYYGRPQEWYTLSENLFRAYELTGDSAYRTFGEAWLYPAYWGRFAETSAPPDAHGVHAYSHANSFSSLAMTHATLGGDEWLRMAVNAFDWLQRAQCFATGGYGPNERMMAPDGGLGDSLDTRNDHFETVCGSWAGFKLGRYLQMLTGEARFGDWMERLFYNGVGAALPITTGGRNYYFSDYGTGVAAKIYNWENYTCCSGTYIQCLADYHNIIYYRDPYGVYVNLYVPSQVTWNTPDGPVRIVQSTEYPTSESSELSLSMNRPTTAALRLRVPGWCDGFSAAVNGRTEIEHADPGSWVELVRTWTSGDRVSIRIPMRPRLVPVDSLHPDRVAVVRGPVVLVQEAVYHDPHFVLPAIGDEIASWLVEDDEAAGTYWVRPPDGRTVRQKFRPYYDVGENFPYMMYFDAKAWPVTLW